MKGIRNILWLLIVVVIVFSCKDKKKLIPRDEIVPVLVDIHMMDGAIRHARYRDDIEMPDSIDVYEYVLEKHGYTQEQFDSSMNHYSRDPRRFEQIYQEVLARLNRMETKVKEDQEEKRKKERKGKDTDQPKDTADQFKRKPGEIDDQPQEPSS